MQANDGKSNLTTNRDKDSDKSNSEEKSRLEKSSRGDSVPDKLACSTTIVDKSSSTYKKRSGLEFMQCKKFKSDVENIFEEGPSSSIGEISYLSDIESSPPLHVITENLPDTGENNSTSIYPDMHCSEYKTKILAEKLKNEDTFNEALCELTKWFEERKYSKKKINLYSMMQHLYFHTLFLVDKKEKLEIDDTGLKSNLVEHLKESCKLLTDIAKAFNSSQEKNNWLCFTNNQKNFIRIWGKHCNEWKIHFTEELASYDTSFGNQTNLLEENCNLSRENDVLRCHLDDSNEQNQDNDSFPAVASFLLHDIFEKLNKEETFSEAASTLLAYLKKEKCIDITMSRFFSLIQCIHNHVTKLHNNKNKYEDNPNSNKKEPIEYYREILCTLRKIEKIYAEVSLKCCSYYLTLEENKNFELWIKYAKELKSNIIEKILENKAKEDAYKKKMKILKEHEEKIKHVKKSNEALQARVNVVLNQIEVWKYFPTNDDQMAMHKYLFMQGAQQEIIMLKKTLVDNENQIKELKRINDQEI